MAVVPALLEAKGVALRVGTSRPPLGGPVDLAVRPGDVLAIAGPSGSGKSTLLRCMVLLEARAVGTICYRGETVVGNRVPAFRRQVVYLPQSSPRMGMTVAESLHRSFDFACAEGSFAPEVAAQLCRRLLLDDDVAKRTLAEVSGGELQRIALVRALLVSPAVLLMDEPTSALDAAARLAVADVLAEWLAGGERAAVLVSHVEDEVSALVTRRGRLDGGALVEAGA